MSYSGKEIFKDDDKREPFGSEVYTNLTLGFYVGGEINICRPKEAYILAEMKENVLYGDRLSSVYEIEETAGIKVQANIKDEDMYFTTDLNQLEDNLENSISVFEFDKENNKYKLSTKTLEILSSNVLNKTIKD